jgi:nitrogen regulatory protein PII-like uncharacterized protein
MAVRYLSTWEIEMNEVKMHTTIYFQVPKGTTPEQYARLLRQLSKEQVIKLITDFGDSEYEVNE